jgi:hypothetical protein
VPGAGSRIPSRTLLLANDLMVFLKARQSAFQVSVDKKELTITAHPLKKGVGPQKPAKD